MKSKAVLRGSIVVAVGALALAACSEGEGGRTEAGSLSGVSATTASSADTEPTGSTGGASEGGATGEGSATTGEGSATGEATTGAATTGAATTGEGSATTQEPASTGGETGGELGSRCVETPTTITCPKITIELGPWQRDVHYQVPLGAPPPGGWPVALMFQGSFFSAEVTWVATDDLPFGAFHQTRTVKHLLDAGFAVITPETKLDGATFWDTNIPPYSTNWEASEDHLLMLEIFARIEDGTFGPLDTGRMFATGVSSGGYMTSRMAIAYPGKFRALAIAAGSYASCSGPLCVVPPQEPAHPPTLFLHGELDVTVPISTAEAYRDALEKVGVETRFVSDPADGHGWIAASPGEVETWFSGHP